MDKDIEVKQLPETPIKGKTKKVDIFFSGMMCIESHEHALSVPSEKEGIYGGPLTINLQTTVADWVALWSVPVTAKNSQELQVIAIVGSFLDFRRHTCGRIRHP